MNILFFTDCMSIGPEYLDASEMYPGLVGKYCEEKYGIQPDIDTISGSGETTSEAVDKLNEVEKKGKKFDWIIFAYGINDALPRGLKRSTRGRIIRSMYSLRLNKRIRLFARAFFLNPLEMIMQYIRKPIQYNSILEFTENVKLILTELKRYTDEKPIFISINPILNYRFKNGNFYLKQYNDRIIQELENMNIDCIDVFKLFFNERLRDYLANDKFHYSKLGHQLVASAIITSVEKDTAYYNIN